MTMLSAAMQVVGGAVGAMGAMKQAEAEAKAQEYNAAVATRNQRIIKQQTKEAKVDQRLENKRLFSAVRAQMGANGYSFTGSALDVALDTAKEQRLEVKRIGYKGKLAQIEQRDARNLALMGADNARSAGQLSAVSQLLGGLGGAATTIARTG